MLEIFDTLVHYLTTGIQSLSHQRRFAVSYIPIGIGNRSERSSQPQRGMKVEEVGCIRYLGRISPATSHSKTTPNLGTVNFRPDITHIGSGNAAP